MSRWVSKVGRASAAAMAVALAAPAAALPGNGIRLGGSEGRVRPFVEVESRYDTNVYYFDANQQYGDAILHVRPGFIFSAPGDLLNVSLRASADRAQYLGQNDGGETQDLSRWYGEATLGLDLNRAGDVSLEVDDTFRRGATTTSLALDAAVIANYNAFSLRVPWRPSGGALVLALGGGWVVESFEPYFDCAASGACVTDVLSRLGYDELRGSAELRWKFLPRTAAVLEASYFARLPNDTALSTDVSGLRVETGLTGLVTQHLGATMKAGYGDTLNSLDEGFGTWLATLELEWIATETASVKGGYAHGFGTDIGSVATAVYTSNRLYGDAKMLLGGRYALRLRASWDALGYGLAEDSSASIVRVEPSLEAELAPWLRAGLGYAYTSRGTTLRGGTTAFGPPDYAKSETWVRVAVTY